MQAVSNEIHAVSSSCNLVDSANYNITGNDIDQLLSQLEENTQSNELRDVVQQFDGLSGNSSISLGDWGISL